MSDETLLSFVPLLVVHHLVAGPAPDSEPWAERFPAAILFADLVGFTRLTRLLEQRGRQGIEELSRLLNHYWDPLIEEVAAHGGDVVKFVGDALLAVWPAVDEDLGRVTHRAAQCGLAISARFNDFALGDGLRLSTKVNAVCGDVMAAGIPGLDGRWRFTLAGPPLAQLEAAAGTARPGDVVLSPEAWAHVRALADGRRLPNGQVRLAKLHEALEARPLAAPAGSVGADMLRAYVPEPVLARLDAGQAEWLAEFRRVTVLFVRITGLEYQSANALNDLKHVMHALESVVHRFEGIVKELTIDDKGTIFVAVLGVPPTAHEDDAIRAVLAAQALRHELRALELRSGIGVATGRTFCGHIGNVRRRDYSITGDPMPLAARLMAAAEPDTVLCDEETYQAARTRVAFEELPRFLLKGVDSAVPVFRPCPAVDATGAPAVQVGRQAERDLLVQRLEALREGRGGVVLIEGEPGIGKSNLVRTLAFDARGLGLRCLIGTCDAIERSTPYYAWRQVFLGLCGADGTADPKVACEWVLDRLASDPRVASLAPLLNPVLSLDLPENSHTAQMVGQVRASNTQELLVHLLRTAAAATPLVLVLDDCQWLDSASWALVRQVSLQAPSVLVVLTTRSLAEAAPPDYQVLAGVAQTQRMRLHPLAPAETHALVRLLLGVSRISEAVSRFIAERAEGNPFFARELAYALRDANLIAVVDGECRFVPGSGALPIVDIPSTVQGVVTSRIDQLPPSVQLTLKLAAVVGRSFDDQILGAIHPVEAERPHLRAHLTALEKANLCQRVGDATDFRYVFTHVITRDVAYELLPFGQRRQLHQALATAYEHKYAENLTPFFPLLAHNFRLAGDTAKALDYLEKAGDQALALFNNEEALQFLGAAYELAADLDPAPDAGRRARWRLQLGQALVNLSRYVEGKDHLEAGLALAGRGLPSTAPGQVLSLVGLGVEQLLHRLWPSRYLGRAAADRDTLLPVHRAYVRLGEAYFYGHEGPLPLVASVLHVLNLAEEIGAPSELAEGYAEMGGLLGLIPIHRLARAYFQRALDAARASRDSRAYPIVWIAAGFYDIGVGEWERALELFQELKALSAHLGDKRRWLDAVSNIISVHELRGDFPPIAALAREFLDAAVHQRDPRNQAEALVRTAAYDLSVGQTDRAIECLDQASAIFAKHAEIEDLPLQLELDGLYGIAYLRRAAPEQALAAANQALGITAESRPTQYFLAGYTGPAEVYLSLLEAGYPHPRLKGLARRACRMLGRYTGIFPIGLARQRLYEALYAWQEGKATRALATCYESLAAAERLAMRHDQARAHYEIGRHLAASDSAREHHLRRAAELFEACGGLYHLSLARQALAAAATD